MSQKTFFTFFFLIVGGLALLNASSFIVRGVEQVVVVRMGEIVQTINDKTGLYFKLPILDSVISLDKRTISMTSQPIQVPTSGKDFITITTSAKWRIADPTRFIKVAKNETAGELLLNQMLAASVRSLAATLSVQQIVGGELSMIQCSTNQDCQNHNPISKNLVSRAKEYGITLEDFRVLDVSHTPNVLKEVENRMIAARLNASESVIESGKIISAEIAAQANLEEQEVLSQAQTYYDNYLVKAEKQVLEKARSIYQENPDFYAFFSTVNTYQEAIGSNTTLMISSDSRFFKHLNAQK